MQSTYKEAIKMLQKSAEEKLLLMSQASSIAVKVQNDDKKTRLFTELPSYGAFTVLVTHPLLVKKRIVVQVW